MENDPEISALQAANAALAGLDDSAKERVLKWLITKYSPDIQVSGDGQRLKALGAGLQTSTSSGASTSDFDSIADCFAMAEPETDGDKALVVATYLQERRGSDDLTAFEINKELTHLGHGVINIATCLGRLIEKKPQLMIQTAKSGKTKQARKKYRVTREGIMTVARMLKHESPLQREI